MMLETHINLYIATPNKDVTNTRFINLFNLDSGNRCKTGFYATYDTVINKERELVEKATTKHRKVLDRTYQSYCELPG